MKESIFKKEYEVSGRNGTVKGEIRVTMNAGSQEIHGTHASTHDDFTKQIPTHKVETFVNGKLFDSATGIRDEETVLILTKKLKGEFHNHLQHIASAQPVKTFAEKMNEIFIEPIIQPVW